MNPDELTKAIKFLRPSAEFSFTENDYSTIKWDVLEGEAPTLLELKDAASKINVAEAAEIKAKENARKSLLERLGITAEEAALLLG